MIIPDEKSVGASPAGPSPLAERLAGLPAADHDQALLELVRSETATVLGPSAGPAIEDESAFFEAGFDSVTAVELRNRLAGAIGLPLSAMLLFDHPTPALLVEHLRTVMHAGAAPAS